MSDCCDTPATSCKPFTKIEEKCAIVDCLYKKVTVTTTVDALCAQTIVITDGDDVLPPDTALVVCKDPTPVISACEKPPAPPVDAPATTCTTDTTVKAADLLSQAVHTPPGTALLVKLCPADPEFDREMEKLCAPDGTKVLVQDVTPKDAPLGTAPTLNFWTLAIPSVPYTGDTSLLKDCGAEKIDISPAAWFCSNNEQVSRSDAWDISVSPRTLIGVIWQDISGAVIPAPAAGTYTQGECAKCEVTKHFEFLNYRTPETTGLQSKVFGLHQGVDGVDFNQSAVGDFEFYLVVDGLAQLGNGAGVGYGAEYPLQFPTLQSIADWLNAHPANTAPKDTWVVTGLAGAQSLVIQGSIGGNPTNHTWADMVAAHYDANGSIDYNFFKTSPSNIDVEMVVPATCRTIEVLKEVDCNRNLTLFGFELDGTPIANFDKANLKHGEAKELMRDICVTLKAVAPATEGVRWDLKEVTTTTPCGDTTVKYFDPDVSPMVEVAEDLIECINGEGKCPCCDETSTTPNVTNKIYLTKNSSVLTVANIIAATGAKHIHSITVKQSLGTGSVTGDVGGEVPLQELETWHWDIISQGQTEFLDTSLLSMNANGGEQRITAIYTI